jgi:hypothetical protein
MNMHGEVIDNSMAFKETVDANGITYPKGSILVRINQAAKITTVQNIIAMPLTTSEYEIPLVGEHVIISNGMSVDTNIDVIRNRYFYSKVINSTDNAAENIVQGFGNLKSTNTNILSRGIRNTDVTNQLTNTRSLAFLQPFEGDKILQSRYGSAIRFSSNVLDTTKYTQKPVWSGTTRYSPIISITNGIESISRNVKQFAIEDINKDMSSIYLTSNQLTGLTLSQPRISLGNTDVSIYNKPQVILNSSRIVLNAKDDSIVLASKKTVSISTPNWAVDADKLFTQINNMQIQLTSLASQVTVLTTLLATSATADIPIATSIGLPGPALTLAGTAGVTSQLSTITSELSKITAILATLKQ